MTDQDHANAIRAASQQLNQAIYGAALTGLVVELRTSNAQTVGQLSPVPITRMVVMRPLVGNPG